MALNQKEARMLDRYIRATRAARAFLEPHPSWKHDDLRREALIAIRDACGGSPGMDGFYREVIGGPDMTASVAALTGSREHGVDDA